MEMDWALTQLRQGDGHILEVRASGRKAESLYKSMLWVYGGKCGSFLMCEWPTG